MAVTTNPILSYGGITEYSWTGITTDDVDQNIVALNSHFEIVQINFNVVGTANVSVNFTGTTNHSISASLDSVFFSQDTNATTGIVQRWADNAGIIVPMGSVAEFDWDNSVEALAWGLSVFVRFGL